MAELFVWMDNQIAATVTRSRSGVLTLTYDDRYLTRAVTPLSVSLPVSEQAHTGNNVDSFLHNLLPDNPNVVRVWKNKHGAKDILDLLPAVGTDVAGKPEFTGTLDPPAVPQSEAEPITNQEIGDRLRGLVADESRWHNEGDRWSLAGFQRKLVLRKSGDGQWLLPGSGLPSTHILKPAIPDYPNHDINEHLCLAAIAQVGIPAASTDVEDFEGITAIAVERYDRVNNGRLHQEDLCQALGVPAEQKYQSDGGPSPEDITRLLRDVSSQPNTDVERFADALAVNWLLRAPDAHAKNYSLLLEGEDAVLAPLYDIGSDAPYDRSKQQRRLAHKIGKENRPGWIRRRHWEQAAAQIGLNPEQLLDRVEHLQSALPDALADQSRLLRNKLPHLSDEIGHTQTEISRHVTNRADLDRDERSLLPPSATPLPKKMTKNQAKGKPFTSTSCNKWMPRAKTNCQLPKDHNGPCRQNR